MASKNVIDVNDVNFDEQVLAAAGPVLVDFSATWCGPCKMLAPLVDKLADAAGGAYQVAKLDIDEAPASARRYNILGVPTVIVFRGGKEAGRVVGLATEAKLRDLLAGSETSAGA